MTPTPQSNTLVVRVGPDAADRTRTQARESIRALEEGYEVDDMHVLVLEDESDLERLVRPTTLALLRAINQHEPASIRQAAELVERNVKEVHRNLGELADLNVVELVEEGRSKRPVVRFEEIEFEVSVGRTDDSPPPDVVA